MLLQAVNFTSYRLIRRTLPPALTQKKDGNLNIIYLRLSTDNIYRFFFHINDIYVHMYVCIRFK